MEVVAFDTKDVGKLPVVKEKILWKIKVRVDIGETQNLRKVVYIIV